MLQQRHSRQLFCFSTTNSMTWPHPVPPQAATSRTPQPTCCRSCGCDGAPSPELEQFESPGQRKMARAGDFRFVGARRSTRAAWPVQWAAIVPDDQIPVPSFARIDEVHRGVAPKRLRTPPIRRLAALWKVVLTSWRRPCALTLCWIRARGLDRIADAAIRKRVLGGVRRWTKPLK